MDNGLLNAGQIEKWSVTKMHENIMDIEEIRRKLHGKTIYVIPYMHADWAWCHTRHWHALRYVAIFEDVLERLSSDMNFKWYMDCYVTELVPFIERFPDRISELAEYIKKGNIAVCGGFSNIRPNMVGDEAYIRNMIIGRKKFRGLFPDADLSVQGEAVDVALGHPQIPQLLKKAGYKYYRCGRPYGVLAKKGIPREFVWEGLDGSSVLAWWGDYGALCFSPVAELHMEDGWEKSLQYLYNEEIKKFEEGSTTDIFWLPHGCDDALPYKVFNSDVPIDIPGIIKKWNQCEESKMMLATPVEFFRELEKRSDNIKVIKGTIDPCDVCYNVSYGGEKSLAVLRVKGDEQICAAEKWMSIACASQMGEWMETEPLWEDNLTASAHATQWLFEEDIGEIMAFAGRCIQRASDYQNTALRNITGNIDLPRNAIAVIFNTFERERTAAVRMTIACNDIKQLELMDGQGEIVPFQVLKVYEYTETVWEYDTIIQVKLPTLGYNTVYASKGQIDCRYGGEYVKTPKPEIKEIKENNEVFYLENDKLQLEFRNGDLIQIKDMEKGRNVYLNTGIAWNKVEFCERQKDKTEVYTRIDTDSESPDTEGPKDQVDLHAGPIMSRYCVKWNRYQIAETGPVRWKIKLWGSNGIQEFIQEITLLAGDCNIHMNTTVEWKKCDGFLAAYIPVSEDARLYGGIPFGMEEKRIAEEPYGQLGGEGWGDIHRQWEGLFFAKNFALSRGTEYCVSLATVCGNRYFIYNKYKQELGYVLINSVFTVAESWEQHVNRNAVESSGKHSFDYIIMINETDTGDDTIQNMAFALSSEPLVIRPRRNVHSTKEKLPLRKSFIGIQAENVVLSAFYMQNNSYILRIWESAGKATGTDIHLPFEPVGAAVEDLIGNITDANGVIIKGNCINVALKPFEIVTLRLFQ